MGTHHTQQRNASVHSFIRLPGEKGKLYHNNIHGNSDKTSARTTLSSTTRRSTGARIHRRTLSVDMSTLPGITRNVGLRHLQDKISQRTSKSSKNIKVVKKVSLCTNCLGKGRLVFHCPAGSCPLCGNRHHTFLHRDEARVKNRPITTRRTFNRSPTPSSTPSTHPSIPPPTSPSTPPRVRKILRLSSSPRRRRRQ